MPRPARIVVPGIAHHVIQRGNRQQRLFFSDADRRAYLTLLAEACTRNNVRCLAWCLMDNHIHLVLIPAAEDGLRGALAGTHTAYSQRINRQQSLSGHLFQGRFQSYPMDDTHLMVAVRYVEQNPVAAGMVLRAEDWRWSSARAHMGLHDDMLTDVEALGSHVSNWQAMLVDGLEAADRNDIVEAALRSGRPLGSQEWVAAHGISVPPPGKAGRKRKSGTVPD